MIKIYKQTTKAGCDLISSAALTLLETSLRFEALFVCARQPCDLSSLIALTVCHFGRDSQSVLLLAFGVTAQ